MSKLTSAKKLIMTLRICWLVFKARTFGQYKNSVGGPDNQDYSVYHYKNRVVCIPGVDKVLKEDQW